ncbi:MAG: hypothetical protein ACOYK6_00555 [Chthoniobacterales bacterium]
MNKTLSLLAAILMTASISFAGQAVSSKKVVVAPDDCRFHAHEWQIDTSTVGLIGLSGGQSKQGLGGNLGVNYFFSKYLGVGIDDSVGSERNAGFNGFDGLQAFTSLQADLLLRYPICGWNLAPYAMIGGGATWGPTSQGDGNVGGGLEWRFMRNLGFFADCRWLYGNSGSFVVSQALPRVGFRLSF